MYYKPCEYPFLAGKFPSHGEVCHGINADLLFVFALTFKFDKAINGGKDGIIASQADVVAGVDLGSSLPDYDVAGSNHLTVKLFDSQAFGFAIPTVAGASNPFLVGKQLKIYMKHI